MPALVCYYRVVMREVGEWIDASALRDWSAEPMKAVVRRSSSNVCAIHLRRNVIAREDKYIHILCESATWTIIPNRALFDTTRKHPVRLALCDFLH